MLCWSIVLSDQEMNKLLGSTKGWYRNADKWKQKPFSHLVKHVLGFYPVPSIMFSAAHIKVLNIVPVLEGLWLVREKGRQLDNYSFKGQQEEARLSSAWRAEGKVTWYLKSILTSFKSPSGKNAGLATDYVRWRCPPSITHWALWSVHNSALHISYRELLSGW